MCLVFNNIKGALLGRSRRHKSGRVVRENAGGGAAVFVDIQAEKNSESMATHCRDSPDQI